MVAPYVGVWIETPVDCGCPSRAASHPMWVCGLKPYDKKRHLGIKLSHPMWVCGLKRENLVKAAGAAPVAPYVGVWIETLADSSGGRTPCVAPYVGVWIETI